MKLELRSSFASSYKKMHCKLIRLKGKRPIAKGWQKGDADIHTLEGLYEAVEAGNIGCRTGTKIANNEYLFVIDIDKKHGASLEKLEASLKKTLPFTFTVRTGGGGLHLFFTSPTPLKSSFDFLIKGVEIKGVGTQVVIAGSLHPETQAYYTIEHDNDLVIEAAPRFLLKLINTAPPKKESTIETEIIEGNRNNMLTKVAGKYLSDGYPYSTLFDFLKSYNNTKCIPALPLNEIEHIVKQAQKWTKEHAELVFLDAENPMLEPLKKKEIKVANPYLELLNSSTGLVRELAQQSFDSSIRKYPQFAIASALSIIGTTAQASYTIPSLYSTSNQQTTALYQVMLAPPAGGKDDYISFAYKYLYDIDKRLVADNATTIGGLSNNLFAFNSRVLIADEFQDQLSNMAQKGSAQNQKLELFKKLYNSLDVLVAETTKTGRYPDIYDPRLSILAAGTTEGFIKHMRGDNVAGGLVSRFMIWFHEEVPMMQNYKEFKLDKKIIAALRKILNLGLPVSTSTVTSEEAFIDYNDKLALILKSTSVHKKNYEPIYHTSDIKARYKLGIDDDAKDFLLKVSKKIDSKYLNLANNNDSQSSASITARSIVLILKVASIVALANRRKKVTLSDSAWAQKLITLNLKSVLTTIDSNEYSAETSSIVSYLKNVKEVKLSTVTQRFRNLTTEAVRSIMFDLILKDDVVLRVNDKVFTAADFEALIDQKRKRMPRGAVLRWQKHTLD